MRAALHTVRKRHLIALLAALALLAGCTGKGVERAHRSSPTRTAPTTVPEEPGNPIPRENGLPGSTDWELGHPGYLTADDTVGQIKGYASQTSVDRGETIRFFVSVNPRQRYQIDVYRLGYYAQAGGNLLWSRSRQGVHQPTCPEDPDTGLIECHWTNPVALPVGPDWTSGVYLAVLTNSEKYQNWIPFVVRNDEHPGALLALMPFATYEAYNDYPDDHENGKSLYGGGSYGPPTVTKTTQAVKVSFDRPFADSGNGKLGWADIDFIRWVEHLGYDVSYITDVDVHRDPRILLGASGVIVVGHSEYWSWRMFTALERARDAGVSLAFLGANDVYRQIRFEPSEVSGQPDRIVVGYKDVTIDPVQGHRTTIEWRNPPVDRPEQSLIGVQYISRGGVAPFVALNTWSWVYAGTGMHDGDTIPNVVRSEYDSAQLNYPAPANRSYVLLSRSPIVDISKRHIYSNASIYQAPSGAWVFAPGTKEWTGFLANYSWGDDEPLVERITANVLDRFLDDGDQGDPTATAPVATVRAGGVLGTHGVPVQLQWSGQDARGKVTGYQVAEGMDGSWWGPGMENGPTPQATLQVAPGHEYRFRVRAYDDRGDVSSWAEGGWFTVSMVNGGNGPVLMAGRWEPDPGAGSGTQTFCSEGPSSLATYHFRGRAIAWVGPTGPRFGTADVLVDGQSPESVDVGAQDPAAARVIFARSWPDSEEHTIQVHTARAPVCVSDFVLFA